MKKGFFTNLALCLISPLCLASLSPLCPPTTPSLFATLSTLGCSHLNITRCSLRSHRSGGRPTRPVPRPRRRHLAALLRVPPFLALAASALPPRALSRSRRGFAPLASSACAPCVSLVSALLLVLRWVGSRLRAAAGCSSAHLGGNPRTRLAAFRFAQAVSLPRALSAVSLRSTAENLTIPIWNPNVFKVSRRLFKVRYAPLKIDERKGSLRSQAIINKLK